MLDAINHAPTYSSCFLRGGCLHHPRLWSWLSSGGHYGSSCFSSSRGFTISDPVWRRRWYRRRVPCREQPSRLPGPAQNALTAAEHEVAARETKAKVGEVLDTSEWSGDVEKVSQDKPGSIKAVLPENPAAMSVIYQPAVSVLHHGSAGLEALGAVGERGRSSRAGVCVRVNGSAWSRPLNIAVQGAGGPFQVRGLEQPHHVCPVVLSRGA